MVGEVNVEVLGVEEVNVEVVGVGEVLVSRKVGVVEEKDSSRPFRQFFFVRLANPSYILL